MKLQTTHESVMGRVVLRRFAFSFAILICSLSLFSQRGNLRGVLTDGSSDESLPGANVYIEGVGMGTITDYEGRYQLGNIPAGTHSVTFRYVGYVTQTQEVTITAGET